MIQLGIPGFAWADLFSPAKLEELAAAFDRFFRERSPEGFARFDAYRSGKGEGMTPEQQSDALLAGAPHLSAFIAKLFRVEGELAKVHADVEARKVLWTFRHEFAKKRLFGKEPGKSWIGTLEDARKTIAQALVRVRDRRRAETKSSTSRAARWRSSRSTTSRAKRRSTAARTGPTSSARAPKGSAARRPSRSRSTRSRRGSRARRKDHHDPARRWPSLHVAEEPRLPAPRRAPPARAEAPRALRRPRARAPRARRLRAHRSPRRPARGRAGDRLLPLLPRPRQGLVLEGPARQQDRRAEEEPARRRARRLPARREDQRDARHASRRRRARRARARLHRQPDVPRHRPPHLQRLHEGVRLPEAGAGQHPADRDARAHRGARAAVGPRDLRPAHALEPAQRRAPARAAVQRQERARRRPRPRGLHARAPPRARGLRRRRASTASRSSRSRSSSPATRRTPPAPDQGLRHALRRARRAHRSSASAASASTASPFAGTRTSSRSSTSRSRATRCSASTAASASAARSTLDDAWELGFDHVAHRGGRGPPDDHRHEEQPRARHPQGERLPHGPAAHRRLQAELASRTCRCSLPAVVIGGGLTAIDTATELLAYYLVQVEKIAERVASRSSRRRAPRPSARCSTRRSGSSSQEQLAARDASSTTSATAPRAKAASRDVQPLLDEWGGVTLVYRKRVARLARVPPEPRGGAEEPRGGRALRREPRADRGRARRARPREGDEVRAPRRRSLRGRAPRAHASASPRARAPTSRTRRSTPGTFELDDEEAVLPGPRRDASTRTASVVARRRRKPRATASSRATRTDGHDRVLLRRQPPVLRGQRRQGDGEREGRLPARRRALPGDARRSTPPTSPRATRRLARSSTRLDDELIARVVEVNRLTPTIVEVVVHAPLAARKFKPGQFYRLQNFESFAPLVEGTRLAMEGLALTGAWVDEEKGLLGTIVLEMGGSLAPAARRCAPASRSS